MTAPWNKGWANWLKNSLGLVRAELISWERVNVTQMVLCTHAPVLRKKNSLGSVRKRASHFLYSQASRQSRSWIWNNALVCTAPICDVWSAIVTQPWCFDQEVPFDPRGKNRETGRTETGRTGPSAPNTPSIPLPTKREGRDGWTEGKDWQKVEKACETDGERGWVSEREREGRRENHEREKDIRERERQIRQGNAVAPLCVWRIHRKEEDQHMEVTQK